MGLPRRQPRGERQGRGEPRALDGEARLGGDAARELKAALDVAIAAALEYDHFRHDSHLRGGRMNRRNFIATAAGALAAGRVLAQAPKVFLDYDQAALDAAYDQSKYAPNLQQVLKRYATNSELARSRLGAPRRRLWRGAHRATRHLPQRAAERARAGVRARRRV